MSSCSFSEVPIDGVRIEKPTATARLSGADAGVRLLEDWWGVALLSLGVSTIFAIVLVLARMPFLGLGAEFFRTALVLHVDLAVVGWFLAAAAGIWGIAAATDCCMLLRLSRLGASLAVAGIFAMVATPLLAASTPILANYVPVLDSRLFLFGIIALLVGVALSGLSATAGFVTRRRELFVGDGLWRLATAAAVLAFWVAVVVFMLAQGYAEVEMAADSRIWGGGHVLQITHTLMLMAAWLLFGRRAFDRVQVSRYLIVGLIILELSAAFFDLLLAISFPVGSPAYRRGFTEVMRWLTWPAPVGLSIVLLIGQYRMLRVREFTVADAWLLASVFLFLLGCLVGAGIREETTAIPAHYHGTVGAVTVAYMAWGHRWLGTLGLGQPPGRLCPWQPLIYASGIALMVVGLAWAGQLGVPRKTAHVDSLEFGALYQAAMAVSGIGGLLAILGAGIFVALVCVTVWKTRFR